MFPFKLNVEMQRWPWQDGYGWRSSDTCHWMKPRFGGGWDYKLGIDVVTNTYGFAVNINLLLGIITLIYRNNN